MLWAFIHTEPREDVRDTVLLAGHNVGPPMLETPEPWEGSVRRSQAYGPGITCPAETGVIPVPHSMISAAASVERSGKGL